MIDVDEALQAVLSTVVRKSPQRRAAGEALGRVLAEDITADIDSPPYDKALMDGYAVRCVDIPNGRGELEVIEEVPAGAIPTLPLAAGQATRVMTGAPLPQGTDYVVIQEHSQMTGNGRGIVVETSPPEPGRNLMRRGESMTWGQTVLTIGAFLRPVDIGLLAEVGCTEVSVIPRPTVAVLPTGDELVEACQVPEFGQIRNTNGPLLAAAARDANAAVVSLGVGRDNPAQLRDLVSRGLEQADVLVLSGGVSAGKRDLVPAVLESLDVKQVFHKVRLKPGKPIWFGRFGRSDGRTVPVFGLPGNPVSCLVCFELFVRPALRKLAGIEPAVQPMQKARLINQHQHRGDRPTYHPALVETSEDGLVVSSVAWKGSADLCRVAAANALVHFPPGDQEYQPGTLLEILWL